MILNGLDILIAALIFMPLERLFALHRDRKLFRKLWRLDVVYMLANGILINFGSIGIFAIALSATGLLVPTAWSHAIAAQPLWLQFFEILLIADLGFYLAHRTFHAVPFLWRIHSVHHSIEEMDWVAGHRVHPLDQILTKSASLIPVFALGFDTIALAAFAVFYHWQSLFIHANIKLSFGPLRWILATPHFHHWHHANQREAWDKNFAGQLPLWDVVFGTLYMPKDMPTRYGVDDAIPDTYLGQLAYPLMTPTPAPDLAKPVAP